MDRRTFLQHSLYSSLLFGAGGLPRIASDAHAAFEPLSNRILANLSLLGGPDMRHIIVPAMPSNVTNSVRNTKEYKYWKHRFKLHNIANNESAWQERWNNEYHHIQINSPGTANHNEVFGIWKGAGWLIKMYEAGKVAFIANTSIGGANRAHDRSQVQLRQGDALALETDTQRSGWGGRLARYNNQNSISVSQRSNQFCFGPVDSPSYDPNQIDNRSFISLRNSRNFGLFSADESKQSRYNNQQKLARSLDTYYRALRVEQDRGDTNEAFDKLMGHDKSIRDFSGLLSSRLETFPVPELIRALYDEVDGINSDPTTGEPRRVLGRRQFGEQIRNLYDCIGSNDVLNTRVVGLIYDRWDSHNAQADLSNNEDKYNPQERTYGVERQFRDVFGGPVNTSSDDLHGGFSALYESLDRADKDKLVITVAGEFGRQLRQNDNARAGTDHGDGNIVMVIGNSVNGGVYGDLFPESENTDEGYDAPSYRTPDITGLTAMDHVFGSVCDWVSTDPTSGGAINASRIVFPRLTLSPGDEDYPALEPGVSLSNLFNS